MSSGQVFATVAQRLLALVPNKARHWGPDGPAAYVRPVLAPERHAHGGLEHDPEAILVNSWSIQLTRC